MRGDISLICVVATIVLTTSTLSQVHWLRSSNNPVIPAWSGNGNDPSAYRYTLNGSVVFDQSSKHYLAWFASWAYNSPYLCISHAYSLDGTVWYTYSRNPVVEPSPGTFDRDQTAGPVVIFDPPYWRMYYHGQQGGSFSIGMATSIDGIHWTKYGQNPVLTPGPTGSWDANAVVFPNVVKTNGGYIMWYSGRDGTTSRIGVATSSDGMTWVKYAGNPVVEVGQPGQWDASYLEGCSVISKNGLWYMLYTARFSPSMSENIGLATSTDGYAWTKYGSNPVFTISSGQWDANNVAIPCMMFVDGKFKMWYSGSSPTGPWQIGLATADPEPLFVKEDDPAPSHFQILQNYPNPFNPSTTIRVGVPKSGQMRIKIFDLLGNEVRRLVEEQIAAGWHTYEWNGMNATDTPVSSGVYFYQADFLYHNNSVSTRSGKMVFIR